MSPPFRSALVYGDEKKKKKNLIYKAKSDTITCFVFFLLFPFMPKQIRIRRMWKLDFCQETKRAVKVLPKKLALRLTHVQKLHPSNFPFIATESTGTALKVSWTSGAHTPHFKRPLTRFLHCKQTSAVCNHMLFASTKVSLLNPAWEQLTFQTKAHGPFLSREPHFLLELNQGHVH